MDEYADHLRACEYNHDVANLHIRLIADFSRWMKRSGISVSELSVELVPRYVRYRRRRRQPHGCEGSAPKKFIYFLQEQKVIPETKIQQSACDRIVEDFVSYLVRERALSPATITYYSEFAKSFVLHRFDHTDADLAALCAADVVRYVQEQTKNERKKRAKLMITALRSFFSIYITKGSMTAISHSLFLQLLNGRKHRCRNLYPQNKWSASFQAAKLRTVFLSCRAPIRSMTVSGLSTRVHYVLDALGIEAPARGTHLFRHSLATNMLRCGASLAEIGELLRHRSTQTTEIYAKVDLACLRQLALPWPGGAQ